MPDKRPSVPPETTPCQQAEAEIESSTAGPTARTLAWAFGENSLTGCIGRNEHTDSTNHEASEKFAGERP